MKELQVLPCSSFFVLHLSLHPSQSIFASLPDKRVIFKNKKWRLKSKRIELHVGEVQNSILFIIDVNDLKDEINKYYPIGE